MAHSPPALPILEEGHSLQARHAGPEYGLGPRSLQAQSSGGAVCGQMLCCHRLEILSPDEVARVIRHRALDSAAVLPSGAEWSRPRVARRLTTRLIRHAELQVWEGSPAQG